MKGGFFHNAQAEGDGKDDGHTQQQRAVHQHPGVAHLVHNGITHVNAVAQPRSGRVDEPGPRPAWHGPMTKAGPQADAQPQPPIPLQPRGAVFRPAPRPATWVTRALGMRLKRWGSWRVRWWGRRSELDPLRLRHFEGLRTEWNSAPVDARNTNTSAIAAGAIHCVGSASGMAARFSGVSIMDGITQFTLITVF